MIFVLAPFITFFLLLNQYMISFLLWLGMAWNGMVWYGSWHYYYLDRLVSVFTFAVMIYHWLSKCYFHYGMLFIYLFIVLQFTKNQLEILILFVRSNCFQTLIVHSNCFQTLIVHWNCFQTLFVNSNCFDNQFYFYIEIQYNDEIRWHNTADISNDSF